MKKECFKCGAEKPLSEFYKHSGMKDGHLNKCKCCNKSDVKRNYQDNIEHYKDYERGRASKPHRVEARARYAKTDGGKEAGNRGSRSWRERNPIKRMASTIVGNAVRGGRLAKPSTCEVCASEPSRLHGHHDDYAFPLIVRWLCPGCHSQWHKLNGEGSNAS
jgi:hypothetical protein